jgi:peptidoglycan/xylan/chitin deacetylase (PgdA/CDA1 family)
MRNGQVINLCFHGIGRSQRELEPGEAEYWISTDQFWRVLDELTSWPSVELSFDDSNASDVTVALPALLERRLTATFFVLAGRLGAPGSLAAADVADLSRHGMIVGSHGMDHRSWRFMTPAVRTAELVEARERIAEAAGAPVRDAACPLGQYDRRLLTDLRRLGYQRVFTSDRRITREAAWLQPRFSVQLSDSPQSLREKILRPISLAAKGRLTAIGLVKRIR